MDKPNRSEALRVALGSELQEHSSLRDYTTMRVGGVADFLYVATTIEMLVSALKVCFDHDIPYLVLGAGSNVIVSDAGFPGLVIINRTNNISFIADKSQVIVDSGCIYARLITESASRELSGIEWWFGLPGTIGGAVHNNAETWGHDMSEVVKYVTLLFPPSHGKPARIDQVGVEWMEYAYRSSKLKRWRGPGKPIILTITLQLRQQRRDEILRRMKDYKQGRFELHQPKGVSSAGSYFKNPGGPTHMGDRNRKPEDSAGWLLDQAGAKKMRIGQAGVSSEHANFLINMGQASAGDMRNLANELKKKVQEKFGVALEEEVEYVGVWPENRQLTDHS